MPIRVIDEQGAQLGVMPFERAIEIASAKGLDVVEVDAQAVPPVCRIMDFGKWQYEQKKNVKEAKAEQTVITVKEIKFRPAVGEHDYNIKRSHAARILRDGDGVKATVHFRGREITHIELGNSLLARLGADLAEAGSLEAGPEMVGMPEGMNMFIILAPNSK
jgi:translation initiation factor IF-3